MGELSYRAAVATLERALVFGVNPSLDGITQLCEALGRPQDSFSVIQVAGTNGKTSTARMIHQVLLAEGVRSALYTSPELQRINERMQIDAGPVGDDDFARAVSAAVRAAEGLRAGAQGTESGFTEFELTTAAALWLFRERGVEKAVLEVGMGGRWDATSVASASVAAITGIGLDHTHILGDSLEKIAAEKAAIIRTGTAAVLGPGTERMHEVFTRRADEVGASVCAVREVGRPSPLPDDMTVRYEVVAAPSSPGGRTRLRVKGVHGTPIDVELAAPAYQAGNIATAIAAVEVALGRGVDDSLVRDSLVRLTLPGRFELVRSSPAVILDGAHNPQAAAVLADAIADAWPDSDHRPTLLIGILADKDARGIVGALAPVVGEIRVTTPDAGRAMPAAQLASIVEEATGRAPVVIDSLPDAVRSAVAAASDGVVITGSLTTAGQARSVLLDESATA